MDPFVHLLVPLLFLLAARMDLKKAVLFLPLAIVPDFDVFWGMHRAILHSFIPMLVLPLALVAYSRLKRPEWTLSSYLVLYYLMSHFVLDLGGVAFLWPFVQEQFYLEFLITFNLEGGINLGIEFDCGLRELAPMGTTMILSEVGLAVIFMGAFFAIVFRDEAKRGLRAFLDAFMEHLRRLRHD